MNTKDIILISFYIVLFGAMLIKAYYKPNKHIGKWYLVQCDPTQNVRFNIHDEWRGSNVYRIDKHAGGDHYQAYYYGWITNYEFRFTSIHTSHFRRSNKNKSWIEISESQAKLLLL
jgi:hypothetical protein